MRARRDHDSTLVVMLLPLVPHQLSTLNSRVVCAAVGPTLTQATKKKKKSSVVSLLALGIFVWKGMR